MVVLCVCAGRGLVSDEMVSRIRNFLDNEGIGYIEFSDFCDHQNLDENIVSMLSEAEDICLLACFPRTIRSLFHAAGITVEGKKLTCLNLRELKFDEVVKGLTGDGMIGGGRPQRGDSADKISSWFPVIDYDLCSNCGRCLEFCLFAVYGRSEGGKVKVLNPRNCKNNCPACARICPRGAIIFPKSKEHPINGAEISGGADCIKNRLDIEEKSLENFYAAMEARKERRNARRLTKE
ncbi:MAG: ferredoxin family protein [Victivallales bacterium]|nr:ferredoxin family protein [Victivallales bacterium]